MSSSKKRKNDTAVALSESFENRMITMVTVVGDSIQGIMKMYADQNAESCLRQEKEDEQRRQSDREEREERERQRREDRDESRTFFSLLLQSLNKSKE